MAMYPFRCMPCDEPQDHIIPMKHYMEGIRPGCTSCGGPLDRIIVPVNEVGTGNKLHQVVDHALSRGSGPSVFNTRSDWEAAMKREGVRPMEPGDAKAQLQNEIRRGEECRAKYVKDLGQRVEKAVDRAMQERGGL